MSCYYYWVNYSFKHNYLNIKHTSLYNHARTDINIRCYINNGGDYKISHTRQHYIFFYFYINHCTNKSYNCITNEGITAPNCSRICCYWIQKAVFVTWAANTLIRKQVCKSVLAFVCFAKISVHLHRWCELDVLSLFLHVMSCGLGERVL